MIKSLLYPIDSVSRQAVSLNGMWGFQLDPSGTGQEQGWTEKLPAPDQIPVPASFADFYTEKEIREYCGDFWYEKDVFVPAEWKGKAVVIRFGSATHLARVWCNGTEITSHEGGFLPFCADITAVANYGGWNHIAVKLNNELSETRMPCGLVKTRADGSKRALPYFDFFNYSGLQRNVWLMALPKVLISDYEVVYTLHGVNADVAYKVMLEEEQESSIGHGAETSGLENESATLAGACCSGMQEPEKQPASAAACGGQSLQDDSGLRILVQLYDAEGALAAQQEGSEGILHVEHAHLWEVRNSYLYTIRIRLLRGEMLLDEYKESIGIRTVEIRDRKILLNGKPVYLKGFGKHEDADIIGRGYSAAVMKRDFELMKWIGANSFRTSHYPYADEVYQMADREGFLIIDEVQAVGCFPSMMNAVEASSGKHTTFFSQETTPQLLAHHKHSVEEMIRRDKNHPSVIAWSLLNEPETSDDACTAYFEEIFAFAHACDPQKRPRTFAIVANSQPDICKCHQVSDFLSLNRYYGWYILGGADIQEAEEAFRKEMDAWMKVEPDKPFIFTEYGADTLSTIDKLPSVMWSESYQVEMLQMCERVFDSYDAIVGEQVWNFADFQTGEGIIRADGNKKGIFTRQRQPKRAAFHLKERWEQIF